MCLDRINRRVANAKSLWLFLDYDGTLADFAPTPDHVIPDPDLENLIVQLSSHPQIRVTIVSGRRLSQVEKLVPVSGVLLAGTYGIELKLSTGERINRVEYSEIRPVLDTIKPVWQDLIAGRDGFFLEDKGWALALHGRFSTEQQAERVLSVARDHATRTIEQTPNKEFRILGGHKFLEIGPGLAHKGRTVRHLLGEYPNPDALPIYLGDDDKDEEAFGVIHEHDGIAILVGAKGRHTSADGRLCSPQAARNWLRRLLVP